MTKVSVVRITRARWFKDKGSVVRITWAGQFRMRVIRITWARWFKVCVRITWARQFRMRVIRITWARFFRMSVVRIIVQDECCQDYLGKTVQGECC